MAKVVVFGATGMVGRPTTARLAADGHTVTIVTRNPETAAELLPHTRVVAGDVREAERLRPLLSDAEAVVIIMPLSVEPEGAFNAERDGTRNIVQVLPESRRVRVVKLSEIGAGSDPEFRDLEAKAEAERTIQASGHPYVIFRPTWFMEAWLEQLRAGPNFLAVGEGRRALHWVGLEDMARWMSAAVDHLDVENRILTVQGADALTMPQAAERLARAAGSEVVALRADGVRPPGAPEPLIQTLFELFRYYERAPEPFEADELWSRLGRPRVTFESFAAKLQRATAGG